jgi:hypothetical protein
MKSGEGSACTNIVTEYRYLPHTHDGDCKYQVDYTTPEEVSDLLKDLVLGYRAWHVQALSSELSAAEQEAVHDKAQRCGEALNSIFEGFPGYSESLLTQSSPNSEQGILESLIQMAKSIQSQRPGGLSVTTWFEYVSKDNLANALDKFVDPNVKPSLWPFVKVIKVFLRSSLLESGIILADLPGILFLSTSTLTDTGRIEGFQLRQGSCNRQIHS